MEALVRRKKHVNVDLCLPRGYFCERVKLLFSISLLFCLTFLNVPKNFVHDCDDHHLEHSDTDGLQIEDEDCFVCEFDLGYFQVGQAFKLHTVPATYFISNDYVADVHNPFNPNTPVLRGPPVIA